MRIATLRREAALSRVTTLGRVSNLAIWVLLVVQKRFLNGIADDVLRWCSNVSNWLLKVMVMLMPAIGRETGVMRAMVNFLPLSTIPSTCTKAAQAHTER